MNTSIKYLALLVLTTLAQGVVAQSENMGFETGNTTGWTVSNTGGAANWNSGSGAVVVNGLQHTPGGGKSWTVQPYGSHMLSIQPGAGASTFDSMTTNLGLTSVQNTAIRTMLQQQAQSGGGNPTPTNASWVKRNVTLQSGVSYSIAWQYLSTDYTPFNDGSIITLVHSSNTGAVPTLNNSQRNYALLGFTNPGTGDYSTGSYGATGWQVARFTVPTDGVYVLGFASFNLGDTALSPILLIDELPGTTQLNGASFGAVQPNPGTGAPPAGGGSVAPTWPATSEITGAQITIRTGARNRVANVGLGNKLYLDERVGSSGNNINIEQTGNYNRISGIDGTDWAVVDGDNNTVVIRQGDVFGRNLIEFSLTGNSNTLTVNQSRNPITGLQDGSESGGHYVGLVVLGNSNTLTLKQSNDGGSMSGHFLSLGVSGSNNTGLVTQSGNVAKTIFGSVAGNSNSFTLNQTGAESFINLQLSGNGHGVSVGQSGSGSHKATVNLTNSGGASTVELSQLGSSAQNIDITQSCATVGGCSVSITQGQ